MKQVQLSDGVSFYIKSHFYTHSNLLHLLPSLQGGGERRVPHGPELIRMTNVGIACVAAACLHSV